MTLARQDAFVAGHQRKHVAGADEMFRPALLVHDRPDCGAALERTDARLAVAMIDGNCEVRRFFAACGNHWFQFQPARGLARHWHADLAPSVSNQKMNELRS